MSWHSNIHFQRIVHRNTFPYTRGRCSREPARFAIALTLIRTRSLHAYEKTPPFRRHSTVLYRWPVLAASGDMKNFPGKDERSLTTEPELATILRRPPREGAALSREPCSPAVPLCSPKKNGMSLFNFPSFLVCRVPLQLSPNAVAPRIFALQPSCSPVLRWRERAKECRNDIILPISNRARGPLAVPTWPRC